MRTPREHEAAPPSPMPAGASRSAEHPSPQIESRRTLIVEDERRLREMLLTSVKEMGFDATGAGSAEAALNLLGASDFAIAVLDLNLPGMDGIELAEMLRQRWASVQIIILTGFGGLDAARRAIRLDAVDFLTKPCGMNELEQALCRAQSRWLAAWAAQHVRAPQPPPAEERTGTRPAAVQPISIPDAEQVISLEEMERQLIIAALERRRGNREAAAADLGISIRKLYYRLHQYQQTGVLPPGWEEQ